MFNSQYYTCEQIDQRLLQGYLDDYNYVNSTNLTKDQFLTTLYGLLTQGLKTGDIVQVPGNNLNKIMSQKSVTDNIYGTTVLEGDYTYEGPHNEYYSPIASGEKYSIRVTSNGDFLLRVYVSSSTGYILLKTITTSDETFFEIPDGINSNQLFLNSDHNQVIHIVIKKILPGTLPDTLLSLSNKLDINISDLISKLNTGGLYIGKLIPTSNPGSFTTKVFAFANQEGSYEHLLDHNGNPITLLLDGLYVLTYDPNDGYWVSEPLYRSDRVFDGGRADTVYGGSRNINCGGAN